VQNRPTASEQRRRVASPTRPLQEELTFVGVEFARTPREGGWHQPDALFADDFLAGFGLSESDSAVLHALMGQERLEFLG